jgi:hypothetical protein
MQVKYLNFQFFSYEFPSGRPRLWVESPHGPGGLVRPKQPRSQNP